MAQPQNIADEKQVKDRILSAKDTRRQELDDLRTILGTLPGRRLIWRLLVKSQMFGSIWEQSAKIHYNSGQQDLGHFIWAEVETANREAVFQMMRENAPKEDLEAPKKSKEETDNA